MNLLKVILLNKMHYLGDFETRCSSRSQEDLPNYVK